MDEDQGPRPDHGGALTDSARLGEAQRRLRETLERERRLAALLRERVRESGPPRESGDSPRPR